MPDLIEPRNWCVRCRIHEAHLSLCPVCSDDDRLKAQAAQTASMTRG